MRFFDKRTQKQQELQDEGGEGGLRHEMKSAGARGTSGEIDEEKTTDNETLASPYPRPGSIDCALSLEKEKAVVRKIDMRLIPLVMMLYLLAYLDRSNIGNAKIAGMYADLHLNSGTYEWLLTIFYISYIVFEPLALMWKVMPPHRWAALTVMGWAVCGTLQAAAFSWRAMMVARFFLGVFEAAFSPVAPNPVTAGVPFLLSFFYTRNELGVRCGLYLSAAPLATCFAGALAYGITSGDSSAIASWRLLFLVEGLPGAVAAALTWFLMPDSPETASFLTREEQAVAKARSVRQVGSEAENRVGGGLQWREVGATVLDWKPWITALMVNAQGVSAPPYFLAFLLVILTTRVADKTSQRGAMIFALSLVGAAGYIMLGTATSVAARYTGVYLAAAGVFPAIGNILPWVLNNQGNDTRRGTGIAMLNMVGQCGPLLGTRLYPSNEGPYYRKGVWICAAFMLLNGVLALSLRFLLVWENKKLDEKHGIVDSAEEVGTIGEENAGPKFRYIL
ncbi:uncharacterized protein L3040_004997 [Drepanopeziza brunnea f. sp. 'multigermtubi']|uniref:uncharacterized protein n=1 Tax=Drepanopeziza brunnea f. sp. 'multigermtubi' TaxID=698441 RepID=UPI00238EFDD5|nr:hypothetical protein L3040_004997 [Drepanopeziza brunnea f. sp. 'multigermtubi']